MIFISCVVGGMVSVCIFHFYALCANVKISESWRNINVGLLTRAQKLQWISSGKYEGKKCHISLCHQATFFLHLCEAFVFFFIKAHLRWYRMSMVRCDLIFLIIISCMWKLKKKWKRTNESLYCFICAPRYVYGTHLILNIWRHSLVSWSSQSCNVKFSRKCF